MRTSRYIECGPNKSPYLLTVAVSTEKIGHTVNERRNSRYSGQGYGDSFVLTMQRPALFEDLIMWRCGG